MTSAVCHRVASHLPEHALTPYLLIVYHKASDLSIGFGKKVVRQNAQKFAQKNAKVLCFAQITRAWTVGARAKRKSLARKQGVLGGFSLPPNS